MADWSPRRPAFHPDYGVPTELPDPVVPFDETRRKLTDARNYWVTTASADRGPHAAPVWGLWLDDVFWFSTDARSVKGRNLAADERTTVHLESGDDVVIVSGVGTLVPNDDPAVETFIAAYGPKYDMVFERPLPEAFSFWRVTPARVSVWTESAFVDTALVWEPA